MVLFYYLFFALILFYYIINLNQIKDLLFFALKYSFFIYTSILYTINIYLKRSLD